MSKNNFVIAEDSEREVISVLILKSKFYDDMTEAYKEWLLNEKNNIVKIVQERELERRLIAEECIKNINSLRQTFGFYPIELGDQSIKVRPSEKEDVFENKEEIYGYDLRLSIKNDTFASPTR
ncbi:31363_t:CDS:2, partial [Racocetra persica]